MPLPDDWQEQLAREAAGEIPPGAADLTPMQRGEVPQGQINGQNLYAGATNGLNPQGFGAAAVGGLSQPPGRVAPEYAHPWIPRADMQQQVNPLTGILEAVPSQQGVNPANFDPWVGQQVQNIERSMDMLRQNQTLSPLQLQHALAKKQQQIQQIDPQGIYGKGGPASQMTAGQKWAGQNIFKDPNTGLVFFHNGREWKVHEPQDKRLEMQQEFEKHKMEMQQKVLDMHAAGQKEMVELRRRIADMVDDRRKAEQDFKHAEAERKTKEQESRDAHYNDVFKMFQHEEKPGPGGIGTVKSLRDPKDAHQMTQDYIKRKREFFNPPPPPAAAPGEKAPPVDADKSAVDKALAG